MARVSHSCGPDIAFLDAKTGASGKATFSHCWMRPRLPGSRTRTRDAGLQLIVARHHPCIGLIAINESLRTANELRRTRIESYTCHSDSKSSTTRILSEIIILKNSHSTSGVFEKSRRQSKVLPQDGTDGVSIILSDSQPCCKWARALNFRLTLRPISVADDMPALSAAPPCPAGARSEHVLPPVGLAGAER